MLVTAAVNAIAEAVAVATITAKRRLRVVVVFLVCASARQVPKPPRRPPRRVRPAARSARHPAPPQAPALGRRCRGGSRTSWSGDEWLCTAAASTLAGSPRLGGLGSGSGGFPPRAPIRRVLLGKRGRPAAGHDQAQSRHRGHAGKPVARVVTVGRAESVPPVAGGLDLLLPQVRRGVGGRASVLTQLQRARRWDALRSKPPGRWRREVTQKNAYERQKEKRKCGWTKGTMLATQRLPIHSAHTRTQPTGRHVARPVPAWPHRTFSRRRPAVRPHGRPNLPGLQSHYQATPGETSAVGTFPETPS